MSRLAIFNLTFATLILGSPLIGWMWISNFSQPPTQPVKVQIDLEALGMIDFSQLDPPLAQFISEVQFDSVIGRSISEFPKLWDLSPRQKEVDFTSGRQF